MATPIPCEALATKTELQELETEIQTLRTQINQLLGQPEEEGGQQIDVLGLGSLAGTILAGTIFKAGEAITDIQLSGSFGSNIGNALLKGDAQFVKVSGRGVTSPLNSLQTVTKANAGKAAIGVQGAKVASSAIGLVANLATIIGTLGINIATVKILGDRIDQVEKGQLAFNQDYTNLINILSRNKQDLDAANNEINELQNLVSDQQFINSELLNDIESAQSNIDDLTATVEEQQQAYNNLETTLEEFKAEVAEFEANTGEQISDLNLTISDLETNLNTAKTNIDILYDVIEQLSIDLADAEKRITEQEVKIVQLQVTTSLLIGEIITLKAAIEADQDLTTTQFESLEAEIVLAKRMARRGGSGTPQAVRETITNQQNKTLELANSLSNNPVENLPTITYDDILNYNNPFNDIFNQLLPTIKPGEGGIMPSLEEISTQNKSDFESVLTTLGIVGLTTTVNDIKLQTSAEAITSAAETAVCNTTAPNGCMTNNIKEPLINGQNNLRDSLDTLGQGLDLIQGQQILNVVTENNGLLKNAEFGLEAINNFAKKAWEATRMDKVLNLLNTVLALHNALMLSRNLGQTLGDVVTQALSFLNIKDAEDNPIDVNEVIGSTVNTWITNLVGAETYTNIQQTWTSLNRIMVAAQGVVFAVQGIKFAVLEAIETVGSWTAKIGNNMMIQGLFEERSFPWMDENVNFRNPFGKFIERINTTEEIVGQVNNLVSSGIEAQENFNQLFEQIGETGSATQELKTSSQKLAESLTQADTDKEAIEQQENLNSASPDIDRLDLIQLEPDEIL